MFSVKNWSRVPDGCLTPGRPYTKVTLALDWTTLFLGDMGEGALHEKKESYCQTQKIKIWSWARHQDELSD
jgi:hypothetical protein